jgi:hypothetical protein
MLLCLIANTLEVQVGRGWTPFIVIANSIKIITELFFLVWRVEPQKKKKNNYR